MKNIKFCFSSCAVAFSLIMAVFLLLAPQSYADAPTPPQIILPAGSTVPAPPVTFEWRSVDTGTGIGGYSYILDSNSGTLPDTVSEGVSTSKTYTGLTRGNYYFHIAAVDNTGQWSAATHFSVMVQRNGFLINNFDHGDTSSLVNNYAGRTGAFQGTPPTLSDPLEYCRMSFVHDPLVVLGGAGASVQLDFSLPRPTSYSGIWTEIRAAVGQGQVPIYTDLRNYAALSFWVKGAVGGERFNVGLKDSELLFAYEVPVANYTSITTSWQKVTIPFSQFTGVKRWDQMDMLVFMYNQGMQADGRIYVDDIVFEKLAADFTATSTNGSSPFAVQFTNRSRGAITNYLWDFGDGATSTEQHPAHIYSSSAGVTVFTVSLTVTGTDGSDTKKRVNYITLDSLRENFMVDMMDDNFINPNAMGFWAGGGGSGSWVVRKIPLHNTGVGATNRVLKITCPTSTDFVWYSTLLWDGVNYFDASDYSYLSFRVKGEAGSEAFTIKMEHSTTGAPTVRSTFHVSITTKWKQVNIPLTAFTGLDKTRIKSVTFYADSVYPHKRETFFIDNVQFTNGYGKPESAGAVRVDRINQTLLVNGVLFNVKGVCYQPVPIGSLPPAADDSSFYRRDFPVIRRMGCNAIRTWSLGGNNILNEADRHNLKVIAGFPLSQTDDFSNAAVRADAIAGFTAFVNAYKNSPALLAWAIGDENNFANGDNPDYYSLCNELARAAYQQEGAAYHPVMIVNGGLFNIGNYSKFAEDLRLNFVDMWGTNVYTADFSYIEWFGEIRDYFNVFQEESSKPLLITAFGADAFRTTSHPPVVGSVNESVQSTRIGQNIGDITAAASNGCIGSCVKEYSDEWWKDSSGSQNTHDNGGFSTISLGSGEIPDNFANEEYWGIVEIAQDGTWDAGDGLDDIRPRLAYGVLRSSYYANTAPALTPVTDKSINADEILTFTVNATDPDGDVCELTVTTLPANAQFIDNGNNTATFSWTPTVLQAGTHSLTFTAFDGDLSDTDDVEIVVGGI